MSAKHNAGDFEVESSDYYPFTTSIRYRGREIDGISVEDTKDLLHALERVRIWQRARLGDHSHLMD